MKKKIQKTGWIRAYPADIKKILLISSKRNVKNPSGKWTAAKVINSVLKKVKK